MPSQPHESQPAARTRRFAWGVLAGFGAVVALALLVAWLNLRDEDPIENVQGIEPGTPALVERGAYLARAGNCAACHSARGGQAYAGGRPIATPFGTLYSSNLTPDVRFGIGSWSSTHFWRALHNGRSKDGRLLYPAFPYPNYTLVTRADSDALYAYLRTLPEVAYRPPPAALSAPYSSQLALAVWRALYFRPGVWRTDAARSAEWNRGSYLVRALGHCDACHAGRNALGATQRSVELGGGLIPMQNWYAPSLASPREASVADWDVPQVAALLKDGISSRGITSGPMAEVVLHSTQHLTDTDLAAMAVFLKELPQHDAAVLQATPAEPAVLERGAKLYEQHCAGCHGAQGQGAPGIYPPLAGNRAVTMPQVANLVRIVMNGGFPPATAGNPRPYGMPPFGVLLSDADAAAVLSYVRSAWGNAAGAVSQLQVLQLH